METQKHGGDDGWCGNRLPGSVARFWHWFVAQITIFLFTYAVTVLGAPGNPEKEDYVKSEERPIFRR